MLFLHFFKTKSLIQSIFEKKKRIAFVGFETGGFVLRNIFAVVSEFTRTEFFFHSVSPSRFHLVYKDSLKHC